MKERLDVAVTRRGLTESREKARAAIMAGIVYVNGERKDKAGETVTEQDEIIIKGNQLAYVSRGGLKLEKALARFMLDIKDKVIVDVGASTGGFTDCALKNGAKKVYAIDVGYGQLAWSLRIDERVVNMERTNIRNVAPTDLADEPDIATIDVAFISLDKVLPTVKELLAAQGEVVALIKPQFEAGREKVGKKGVVKDARVHAEVITNVLTTARNLKLYPAGLDFSPVKGPEGNIEYLVHLVCDVARDTVDGMQVERIVEQSHAELSD